MSKNSFSNELERALARPDIEQLKKSLVIYHAWTELHSDEFPDEIDIWFDGGEDFDRGLALVMLAASTYDDPKFLNLVAAGILEDLVARLGSVVIEKSERILAEARKTPRLRWMLSCVWTGSASPETQAAIASAVRDIDCNCDPLPPRPWS